MVPAFLIWVGHFRRYGKQLRKFLVNMKGKCASIMVPVFWICVGNVRRYGSQLREYLEIV
jgi:hypothetical protein